MTPEELAAAIAGQIDVAVAAGEFSLTDSVPQVKVERPRSRDHGDWATNVALQLSRATNMPARDLAAVLAPRIAQVPGVAAVDIAGPGFLNIKLAAAAAGELARTIVEQGEAYGKGNSLAGVQVNVEFVSANPTGPIHLGGSRWAAVGDSLARLLEFHGAQVTREYYFNDHGQQIDRFAKSLLASARGQAVPEDGYQGAYIEEIAAEVIRRAPAAGYPDVLALPDSEAQEVFRSIGVELMFSEIKKSLQDFGVEFDVYFHENSLHEDGQVATAIERLKSSGALYEHEGAWWLRSSEFGDEKDRVVIKSDGTAAYIAGDIAYIKNKRDRGADLCIYLLGADHHGYIARLKAAAAALGYDPDCVEVIIGQMVSLVSDGAQVRQSKRAGTVVTLEDLVQPVGVDAARYALARSSADATLDIDLDLWAAASNANPVFYVQYAHARTCGVRRNAAAYGVAMADGFDAALLTEPSENELLALLGQFPQVVAQAVSFREQHRIARYLEELAAAFHAWYDRTRVTPQGDEPVSDLHRTRLWLNEASAQVLRSGLNLLGVSAPERM